MLTLLGAAQSQEFFRQCCSAFEKALVSKFSTVFRIVSHCTYCPLRGQEAALLASAAVFFEVFLVAIGCRFHYLRDEQLFKLHTILFGNSRFHIFGTPKTQVGTLLAQGAVVLPSAASCLPLASGICGSLPTVLRHFSDLPAQDLAADFTIP